MFSFKVIKLLVNKVTLRFKWLQAWSLHARLQFCANVMKCGSFQGNRAASLPVQGTGVHHKGGGLNVRKRLFSLFFTSPTIQFTLKSL